MQYFLLTSNLQPMKTSFPGIALVLLVLTVTLSSCQLAADIFKAGMGVGIFIVVAIIVGIIALIAKVGRS